MNARTHDPYKGAVSVPSMPVLFSPSVSQASAMFGDLVQRASFGESAQVGNGIAAWRRLQRRYCSSSIGVVSDDMCLMGKILSAGFGGAPVPGAIAVMPGEDCDCDWLLTLLEKAEDISGLFEWPSVQIWIESKSARIAPWSRAVRRMRTVNIPVTIEVYANVEDVAEELERFFSATLTPMFPQIN